MKSMNYKKEYLVLLVLLALVHLSSAEIIISQPNSIYNKGDDFDLSIKLTTSSEDVSDFLKANLVCEDEIIELYKSPVSLDAGEEKEIEISTTLGKFLVGSAQ